MSCPDTDKCRLAIFRIMTLAINRDAVADHLDQLRETYGDLPIEEVRDEIAAERFERVREDFLDGYVGGAYAWVVRGPDQRPGLTESMSEEDRDDRRRALMILSRGSDRWGLPGGGLEGDETFDEAAVREVREETGVDCRPSDPFLVERVRAVSAAEHDDVLHGLRVFFDAEYEGNTISIQPGELAGAAWFAEPPERMHPQNERRAEAFF